MVIISNPNIIYDIFCLNLTISTNGKVSDLLIIMLITVRLEPQQQGRFLPQIPYLYIFFCYLKTCVLMILNKTENHKEDLCLKIYAFILKY